MKTAGFTVRVAAQLPVDPVAIPAVVCVYKPHNCSMALSVSVSHAFIKAEAARQVNGKTRKLERAPRTRRAFAQNHNDLPAKCPQVRSVERHIRPGGTQLATFAHMRLTHLLCGFRLDAQLRRRAQRRRASPIGSPVSGSSRTRRSAIAPAPHRFSATGGFRDQLAEQQAQILFARRLVGFIAVASPPSISFSAHRCAAAALPLILQQLAEKRPLNRVHIIRIRHGQRLLRIR